MHVNDIIPQPGLSRPINPQPLKPDQLEFVARIIRQLEAGQDFSADDILTLAVITAQAMGADPVALTMEALQETRTTALLNEAEDQAGAAWETTETEAAAAVTEAEHIVAEAQGCRRVGTA